MLPAFCRLFQALYIKQQSLDLNLSCHFPAILCCCTVGFFLRIATLTKSKYYFYIRLVNILEIKYNKLAKGKKLFDF